MRKITKFVGIIIGIFSIALLFRYGTLSPCGMLKKEIRYKVFRSETNKSSTSSDWLLSNMSLKKMIAGPMIDSIIESMSPMECASKLIDYHTNDGNIFSSGHSSMPSSYDNTNKSDLKKYTEQKEPEWQTNTMQSPIDSSNNVYLSIDANESISSGPYKHVTPKLHIRCKEDKTTAYIFLGAHPTTQYDSSGNKYAYLTVKYDDNKAYKEKFETSTVGESVFFSSHIPTVKKMLRHKTLLIQFTHNNSSREMITFDISGLGEQIGPLRKACHW